LTVTPTGRLAMNIVLWVLQILLAVAFGFSGLLKLTQPKDKLRPRMGGWIDDFSDNTIKLIGAAEVLGGLGLILPAATGILPWLTPLAAVGLAVIMVLAAIIHARRKENSTLPINVVLFVLAAVVVWGRFGPWSQ
jgi:uncharacterized membrane protein YphA (DoxX/SURF4 family)